MRTRFTPIKASACSAAAVLLLLSLHLSPAITIRAQTATQSRQLQHLAPVNAWPGKAKRWALVIGVDDYSEDQISKLNGAANDARTLSNALVRYAGFPQDQVTLLASDQPTQLQPRRSTILRYLSNLRGLVPKDGLLLVAFAGHGIERGGRAYLLPSDALAINDVALLEDTAISVERMKELIRATGVGQVVLILDACRNDPAAGRGGGDNLMTTNFSRSFNFDVRNREVNAFVTLYATAVGQRAYEYGVKKQGYFTWALVEGLQGAAANEKGEVTLGSLVRYVQETVPKYVQRDIGQDKQQRPFATVEGYKADELVVAVSAPPSVAVNNGPPVAAKSDPAAIEQEYWESIKNSTDAEDFRDYLKAYPEGPHAVIARSDLRRLEASKASSLSANKTVETGSAVNTGGTATTGGAANAARILGKGLRISRKATVIGAAGGGRMPGAVVRNQMGMELVWIPAGSFMMGSTNGRDDEKPVHQVTIAEPFYLGKYEVTQAQWQKVMGTNPSYFKGDNLPVELVSWIDAQEFIRKLNEMNDGYEYRLPSEAEWEYACRAGTTGDYAGDLDSMAWYSSNSGSRTHPVGQKQANAFGLYDMHGSVGEWCEDYYHDSYQGAPTDGSAWLSGGDSSLRVLRGGSWGHAAGSLRSADRGGWHAPDNRDYTHGVRVAAVARQ